MAIIIGQRVTGTEAGRRRRGRFITHALPIGVVAGCMIVLIIWMNAGNVERQLSQLSFDEVHHSRSKFAAWRSSQQLVEDAPWLGIGRGSFESTFTRVHPPSGMATYSHLENEYLQTVVDWGIPAAMILGFFAIWLAFVGLRRWRDGPLTAGALGAVAVVAIQSNVDFGLELLGLAAPMTLVAATLSYVPMREIQAVRRVRALRVAHAVGLLIGSVLLMTSYTTTLDEDHRALARRPTLENARAAIVRHPLDYYSYAVAAELSDRRRDPRAIRLLNHAMILHPTHPDLHRAAGRMLFRDGFVDQATIEYATALRASHDPPKLVREILAKFPPEKAPLAFPTDYPEPGLLVRQMMDAGHADIATAWLERVLALGFKSAKSCEQLYILADQGSHEAADIAARRCIALLPDYQARLRLASMLARANKHDLILGLLEDIDTWQSRVDDKITAWLVLCDAHAALGRVDDAKRCLRRLDASPDMRRERSPEVIQRLEELKSAATGSAATP
jgi:tetratricopeptide (TPR) repeat protein